MTKLRRAAQRAPDRPGSPGGKRDRNRHRRVREICDAALALCLERGIAEVTIEQIAERAAIAKGSVYHYFADKPALIDAVIAPFAEAVGAALERCHVALAELGEQADPAQPFIELGLAIAQAIFSHQDVVRLYLQESRGPATGARMPLRNLRDRFIADAIELGLAARGRSLFRDYDPHVPPIASIGAAEALLFEHFCKQPFANIDEISRDLIRLLLDGLRFRSPVG